MRKKRQSTHWHQKFWMQWIDQILWAAEGEKLPGNQKSYDEQYSLGHREGPDHQPSALYNPLFHFNIFKDTTMFAVPKLMQWKPCRLIRLRMHSQNTIWQVFDVLIPCEILGTCYILTDGLISQKDETSTSSPYGFSRSPKLS